MTALEAINPIGEVNRLTLEDEKLRGIILKHRIPELMKSSNDSSAKNHSQLRVMQEFEFPGVLCHHERFDSPLNKCCDTTRNCAFCLPQTAARAQMHRRVHFINRASFGK